MAIQLPKIEVELPLGAHRELCQAAAWCDLSVPELLALIVQRYLHHRRQAGPITGFPPELEMVAQDRKRLLMWWRRVVALAPHRGRDRATTRFLQRLWKVEGERVSRSTLYNWDRQYKRHGVAGLIDDRKWNAHARPVKTAAERAPTGLRSFANRRSNGV